MKENKLGQEPAFPTEVEHDGVVGMGLITVNASAKDILRLKNMLKM